MAPTDPTKSPLRILSLEDSPLDFELIQEMLIDSGFKVKMTRVENEKDFFASLKRDSYHLILADYNLPGIDTFDLLEKKQATFPDVPYIVVSGAIGEETAIELIKQGAVDYVLKDRPRRLPTAIRRALADVVLERARKQTETELEEINHLARISGEVSRLGGWSVDLATNTSSWSDIVADIHGMPHGFIPSVEEGIQFYAPEYRDRISQVFNDCAEQGIPYDEELQIINKQGERVWVRTIGDALRNEGGKIIKVQGGFQDITERKRAEEALHQSQMMFSNSFEYAAIGMSITDPEGHYLKVNPALCKMLGFSETELLGKTFQEITHPDDIELDQAYLERLNAGAMDTCQFEKRYIHKDGRVVWALVSVSMIRDASGTSQISISQVNDITERKKASEDLKARESLLNKIFDVLPVGLWFADPEGALTRGNPAGIKIWGAEPTVPMEEYGVFQARRLPSGEPVGPEDWALAHTIKDRLTIKDEMLEIDAFDGVKRTILNYTAPVEDDDGNLLGAIIVNNDITELKLAENQLRESEEKFRKLVDNVPGVVYLSHKDAGYTMLYLNDAIEQLTGYPKETFLNQDIQLGDLVHPEDADWTDEVIDTALDLGQPFHLVYRLQHKDGTLRWLEEWGVGVFENETLQFMEGFITDITERKQVEDALVANERIFHIALKNSPVTVFQQDQDLRYTWIHNEINEVIVNDAVGKTDFERFNPETAARLTEIKQRVIETGNGERAVIKSTDEKLPLYQDLTVEPMRDDEGQIRGITCSSVDITPLKIADEAQERRLEELEALMDVIKIIQDARSVDEVLPKLLQKTLNTLDYTAGCIYLLDPASGELIINATTGWFEKLDETSIKPGRGITGHVFSTGETHITDEFISDPLVNKEILTLIPPGWGGAAVAIPALDDTIGVFFVSYPKDQGIDPFKLHLLTSLARMAGITLHRMTLIESILNRLDKLSAQRKIDQVVASLTNLPLTLEIICAQAVTRLPADAVGVLLYASYEQTLIYVAGAGFAAETYQSSKIPLGSGIIGKAALDNQTIHIDGTEDSSPAFERSELFSQEDFSCYTGVPLIAKGQVKGLLEVFHHNHFHHDTEWLNDLESLATQTAVAIDTLQMYDRLQRSNLDLTHAYDATIEGWSMALDLRDNETEGHSLRVTELTLKLARAMGMNNEDLVQVKRGALLHDMGKLGVPDAILFKPGPLTDDEWKVMKEHPRLAFNMLSPINYLRPALDIPYYHHEKWDGSGYPNGLKGRQIPLSARIFAIADVYDALRADRPYRDSWSKEKVVDHIRSLSGSDFDPDVVAAFCQIVDDLN